MGKKHDKKHEKKQKKSEPEVRDDEQNKSCSCCEVFYKEMAMRKRIIV